MFAARYLQRNSRLLTRASYTDGLVFDKMFVALTRENPRTTAIMHGVSEIHIFSRVRIGILITTLSVFCAIMPIYVYDVNVCEKLYFENNLKNMK